MPNLNTNSTAKALKILNQIHCESSNKNVQHDLNEKRKKASLINYHIFEDVNLNGPAFALSKILRTKILTLIYKYLTLFIFLLFINFSALDE
jgi:hypothetical protein